MILAIVSIPEMGVTTFFDRPKMVITRKLVKIG